MLLGDFQYDSVGQIPDPGTADVIQMIQVSEHATMIFFWTFSVIIVFILINMFVSIVIDAWDQVKDDALLGPEVFHVPLTACLTVVVEGGR